MLLAALFLSAGEARAVVLDWDAVTWTANPPNSSNSYDVDPDPGAPGNDITVAVTSGATLGTGALAQARDTSMQGGLATFENTLTLTLDLTANTQYVTITVTFSSAYTLGVTNVSFQIFDVDFANENGNGARFQDRIGAISGLSIDGMTLIAPTITTSANNTVSGTGLDRVIDGLAPVVNTGAGSGGANVTIDFGTNAIRSFTFTYGSGANAPNDPTQQKIGIHDINFTPVPEINPALASILSCIGAIGLALHHRSRVRSRRK